MGDARKWIVQMLQPNISCREMLKIGKSIANDSNLKENHKFILRKLWLSKYEICKINESLIDIK